MIAIDTNVLVRYFVGDDPKQAAQATEFIEQKLSSEEPGFVTLVAVAELSWVLRSVYKQPPSAVAAVVSKLLTAAQIVVEESGVVETALSGDYDELADALIHAIGRANGCRFTITFDRRFANRDGVELLA